eukprot:6195104-Pleurochrysis_carterae.AAC.1
MLVLSACGSCKDGCACAGECARASQADVHADAAAIDSEHALRGKLLISVHIKYFPHASKSKRKCEWKTLTNSAFVFIRSRAAAPARGRYARAAQ